jgi:hypothetical protein
MESFEGQTTGVNLLRACLIAFKVILIHSPLTSPAWTCGLEDQNSSTHEAIMAGHTPMNASTEAEVRPVKDAECASECLEKTHPAEGNDDDVGYQQYLTSLDIEFTAKEERQVRWKLDVSHPFLADIRLSWLSLQKLIVLPIFLITQLVQFLDKSALNYANVFGYQ